MADNDDAPYLGEVRLVPYGFAPASWALCDGQLLPIQPNAALFSLIGTTYGGNGSTTFALPDLRGRVPMHAGGPHVLGERDGAESVALAEPELPAHDHMVNAVTANANAGPKENHLASANALYQPPQTVADTTLAPDTISDAGQGQPHENRQPYLTMAYVISLSGTYPSTAPEV